MSEPPNEREVRPDPQLRWLLERSEPLPPPTAADLASLQARIREAAALELAARRRRARGAGWWRAALPLAAAASLAGIAYFGVQQSAGGGDGATALSAAAPAGAVSAEEALRADLRDGEFVRLVSGDANAEAWLLLAVDDG